MTGPWSDCPSNACVWSIILVPVSAFYGLLGPTLSETNPILLGVVSVAFFWTMVCLIITGWSDPGIIPRQTIEDALRQARAHGADEQEGEPPSTLTMEGDDGEPTVFRYCPTCHIYKPPRASHCSDCDNCCKEFDHHCPFVGNCVGQRNYGAFCAFLICVVALLVSVLSSFVVGSTAVANSQTTNLVFAIIILVFSILMCAVIGGFSAFHCGLVLTGRTTKEQLKGTGKTRRSRTLCCKRPPSLLNLRDFAAPEIEPV